MANTGSAQPLAGVEANDTLRGPGSVLLREGAHATVVLADPARQSWLATWTPETLEAPERVDLRDAIDVLATIDEDGDATRSIQSLAYATKFALNLIARGKLAPGLSPTGVDQWKLGPFDSAEQSIVNYLMDTSTSEVDLVGFAEGVADAFVRTAAAVSAAGHNAFADRRPVVVDHRAQTKAFQKADASKRPLPVLRLLPPDFSTDGDQQWVARLGLASRFDTTQILDARSLWSAADPNSRRYLTAERQLLDAVRRAATVWRPLAVLAEQRHPTEMPLTPALLDDLLGEARQDLGAVGLSVIIPHSELRSVDLRPVVYERTDAQFPRRSSGLDLGSLLEVHWQGELDGLQIAPAEIEQLVQARQRVISIRGQWVHLDPEQIDQIRNPEPLSPSAALAAAVGVPIRVGGVEQQVTVRGTLAKLGQRLGDLADPTEVMPPASLVGELRPYQQRGLAWLREMLELGLGGILADDMGLGKTIQVLALLLSRLESVETDDDPEHRATALVVCPASVVRNWEREANRFAPDLRVIRHHGQERELPELQPGDIVLTTYGVCRRDIDILAEVDFGVVIADEAQAIKNPNSRTARAMRRLKANARFALTGTPVQNQLSDLWAILDWTTPGLLGTLDQFRTDFSNPIERQDDESAAEQLSAMLRPFLLRRRKTDPNIAPDLPPKTETSNVVSLFPEQEAIYRTTVDTLLGEVAAASGIGRRGLVLKLLTQLKQICNHPAHFAAAVTDDMQSVDRTLRGRSGKLEATLDLLDVVCQEGEKTLIFTQYVAMGKLLKEAISAQGISTEFLHGGQSLTERQRLVDDFQAEKTEAFIVSLRAGGTGLNLTAASHVIHFDRWWNPAVEDQASDRAWRIGQTKPVQVHRLISEGTVEDKIDQLLSSKRELAEIVVGAGEAWISDLSNDELGQLVRLGDGGSAVTLTDDQEDL